MRPVLSLEEPVVLTGVAVPDRLWSGPSGQPAEGRAAEGLSVTDLGIAGGCFRPAGELPGAPRVDARGWTLLPGLVEPHVHLDKAYTVSETGFSDGTLRGAIALHEVAARRWSREAYRARMDRAVAQALAAGTRHMRSHIDCSGLPDATAGWQAALDLRESVAGRVDIQLCALGALGRAAEADFPERCRQVAAAGGVLGTFVAPGETDTSLFAGFLRAAEAQGLDVDFHIDEGLVDAPPSLPALAEAVLETGYGGRVLAGHGCALTLLPEAERDRALDRIAEAGIAVAALPRTNLYLQDRRPGGTPLRRGITLVHEMRARGVPVVLGADNVADAFYPLGDYDLLRLLGDAVMAAHLDAGDWIDAVAGVAADVLGIAGAGRIAPGARADAVLVPAADWPGLLTGRVEDRLVLRAGRALDTMREIRVVAQGGVA